MISGFLNENTIKHCCFFVCLLGGLASCSGSIDTVKEILDKQELKRERAEDVTIIYSKDGHTRAKLFTKTFNKREDVKPTFVEMKDGLRVDFYDADLAITSTLTAKYGRYFESLGNVLVKDSVEIKNNKGETLHTEELVWNEKLQSFYTEKFVKVRTPTQIIYGDGLEANQDFSEYTIINVTGVIAIDKKETPSF